MIDLIFLGSLYLLQILFGTLLPTEPEELAAIRFAFLILAGIIVLQLFIYSLCKYSILYHIRAISQKTKFNLKNLAKFFALNAVLAFFILFIILLLNMISLALIKQDFIIPYYIMATYLVFGIAYIFVNVIHFSFDDNIKKAITKGVKLTYKKFHSFLGPIIVLLVFLALNMLILFFINSLMNTRGYNILYLLSLLIIIAFNRIYFYLVIEKHKNVLQ